MEEKRIPLSCSLGEGFSVSCVLIGMVALESDRVRFLIMRELENRGGTPDPLGSVLPIILYCIVHGDLEGTRYAANCSREKPAGLLFC